MQTCVVVTQLSPTSCLHIKKRNIKRIQRRLTVTLAACDKTFESIVKSIAATVTTRCD